MKKFARIMSLALVIVSLLAVALPAFALTYEWDGSTWKRLGFTNTYGAKNFSATINYVTPSTSTINTKFQFELTGTANKNVWHDGSGYFALRTNTPNQNIYGDAYSKSGTTNRVALYIQAPGQKTTAAYTVSAY